jgi:hypothetical protein
MPFSSLHKALKVSGLSDQAVIQIIQEGIKMECLNRDAQKLVGNHQEYLDCELRIAQAELFLHALRYGEHLF